MHLYLLPRFIIKRINTLIANFLWFGAKGEQKYHLMPLEEITMQKEMGGWGLKTTKIFDWDFLTKSFMHAIFDSGLWQVRAKKNYFKSISLHDWLNIGVGNIKNGSYI